MIPRSALNEMGHRRGKNWTDFVASVPSGITLLSEEEYELLYGKWGCYTQAIKNIESHHAANTLLFSNRKREWNVQILWKCPRTGLERKAEIDVVLPRMKIIVDVKTAQDPTPKGFPWAVRKFGYDIQAATYLEAITSLSGKEGWRFAFVVIRNSAPYDCFVYEDTPEWLAEANMLAGESLDYFMTLQTSGNWFPVGWGQSIKLEPQYRGAFNAI